MTCAGQKGLLQRKRTSPSSCTTRVTATRWSDRIVTLPWVDDLGARLSGLNLAISRSGAMFCSELAAAGVPALLVPFLIATFLALITVRPMLWLQANRVPTVLAALLSWSVNHSVLWALVHAFLSWFFFDS